MNKVRRRPRNSVWQFLPVERYSFKRALIDETDKKLQVTNLIRKL